jgi:hypothetical protein
MGRNQMNRKLIALIAMIALAGTGAFAQFALGVTGAVYDNARDLSANGFSNAWYDLKHGDGYLGFFAEAGMDHLAVGASVNFSTYDEDWGVAGNNAEMINVDGNLYLQGHLFKFEAFLDPFLEVGFGRMSTDYRTEDPDPDNPLFASYYWDFGGGLGLNIGSIGIFIKGLYNGKAGEPVQGKYWNSDTGTYEYYDTLPYAISNLKFIFGAKIIF